MKAGPFQPMVGDPDDHRPYTTWRLVVDPSLDGREAGLAVLMEHCAAGDRIPLHRHDVDEVVIVIEGDGEYHLAGEVQHVAAGDVVFIAAGTVHGTANTGSDAMHLHAVFPSRKAHGDDRAQPGAGNRTSPSDDGGLYFATGEFEVLGPTQL